MIKRKGIKHPNTNAYSHMQGAIQDPALHPVNNLARPGMIPLGPSGDSIAQAAPQGPQSPGGGDVEYY